MNVPLPVKAIGTETQETSLVCHATGIPKPTYEFYKVRKTIIFLFIFICSFRPLGYERVYLPLTKWQIHPFISKGTKFR